MSKGFGSPPKYRTKQLWVSLYSQDNEDEPMEVKRLQVPFLPGQNPVEKARDQARLWMNENSNIWDVLIYDGPDQEPASGDAILVRMCREPFNECVQLQ
jgi:hypothetical protein